MQPIILLVILSIVIIVEFVMRRTGVLHKIPIIKRHINPSADEFRNRQFSAFIKVCMNSYGPFITEVLLILFCIDVGSYKLLNANPAVQCNGNEYVDSVRVTYGLFPIIFGFPLLIFVLLFRSRKRMNEKNVIRRLGVFFLKYKDSFYFWDVFLLIKRLAIAALSLIQYDSPARSISLVVVTFGSLVLQLIYRPFLSDMDNNLETVSLTLLFISCIYLDNDLYLETEQYLLIISVVVFGLAAVRFQGQYFLNEIRTVIRPILDKINAMMNNDEEDGADQTHKEKDVIGKVDQKSRNIPSFSASSHHSPSGAGSSSPFHNSHSSSRGNINRNGYTMISSGEDDDEDYDEDDDEDDDDNNNNNNNNNNNRQYEEYSYNSTTRHSKKYIFQDPENRQTIVKDQGCLPALVMFMSNDNEDVSALCLETLLLLAQTEQNVQAMSSEPGLVSGLQKMTGKQQQVAQRIVGYLEQPKKQSTTSFSMLVGERVPIALKQSRPSPSVSSANTPPNITTTVPNPTVQSNNSKQIDDISQIMGQRVGMNNEATKKQVEECLLHTKGVISFMIDLHSYQATIRCTITPDQVKTAIRNTLGLSASLMIDGQEEVNQMPDYLDEINPNLTTPSKKPAWGWNSIVSFGSMTQDKATDKNNGNWGWGSISKALFG
ncbi:hypothetical protein DFA_00286 [Cavenderia fasciculata]|uniref:Armadillo repeat-containing protein 1 n=1 Tax=Cavenderia fasciculata TaxID=261658 RepID=F4PY48_CACFS|nr:uncharacterized protein DFA_00286 [Cavenderia fasciculata]EGG19708.1 hypothetical protein DFA_00286 [Cavenderia fasciculata]|eukprot:XP_004358002.1 hypothetical protein DFA_00286 [Cavenderia fasciculata]